MFSRKLIITILIALAVSFGMAESDIVLEQSLEHSQGLACQVNTVKLVVKNNSNQAIKYTLSEVLPKGVLLADGLESIAWMDKLEAKQTKSYSFDFALSAQAASSIEFEANLLVSGQVIKQLTSLEKLNLSAELERVNKDKLYAGDSVEYKLNITNPLSQAITVDLKPAAVRLAIADSPKNIEIAANSTSFASIKAKVVSPGRTVLQVLPYVCDSFVKDQAAGPAISVREEAKALAEMPLAMQSSSVTLDLAAYNLVDTMALVVVQKLPEDASYVMGSSLLNGESIADPKQFDNYLVYELPDFSIGQLGFTIAHSGDYVASKKDLTIIALSPEPILVVGDKDVLEQYQTASVQEAKSMVRERVGAVILNPQNNSVIHSGNFTSISADMPLGASFSLLVNGEEVGMEYLGEKTTDDGLGRQTLDYYGIALLQGPNQIILNTIDKHGNPVSDEITVFVAGSIDKVNIIPLSDLVADSNNPLKFAITARDKWSKIPNSEYLSLEIKGADAFLADADPQKEGYQVKLKDGYAELVLAPVSDAREITISNIIGKTVHRQSFEVKSNLRPWIVDGYGSVGANYNINNGSTAVGAEASFFSRGHIFNDYLLTVAANYPNKPLGLFGSDPYENAYEAFPITGSSGAYSQDAYSQDGVYARIEKDQSYLQYGDFNTQFEGELLQLNRPFTGLSGKYKDGNLNATAYASYEAVSAMVRDQFLKANGLHVYNLGHKNEILPDSLNLKVVKGSCDTAKNFIVNDNDPLVRALHAVDDYSLDERSSVLRLNFYLPAFDAKGACYYLQANYRLKNKNAQRAMQFGGQVNYNLGNTVLRAGAFQENGEAGKATTVVATAASYTDNNIRANAELAYGQNQDNSGLAAAVQLAYSQQDLTSELKYRFYSDGYRSNVVTSGEQAGHEVNASAQYALTNELDISSSFGYSLYSKDAGSKLNAELNLGYKNNSDYYLGETLIGRQGAANFGVGYELNRAKVSSVRAIFGLSIRDFMGLSGTEFSAKHAQGTSLATKSTTDFSIAYQIAENLSVRFTDRLVWGNENSILLGFDSGFSNNEILSAFCLFNFCEFNNPDFNMGQTKLTAEYSLGGGANSKAGRLRLGANTVYPITDELSLNAGVNQTLDFNNKKDNKTNLTVGLGYNNPELKANLSYDVSFGVSTRHYIFGGTTFEISNNLFGSLNAEYNAGEKTDGSKFSLAGAYRGDALSLLTNHTARFGMYALDNGYEIYGDTRLNIPVGNDWSIRAGYIYDLNKDLGFRDMYSLGATAFLWQGGGISAYGRFFNDWKNKNSSLGATLELSQNVGCGVHGVAGYNFLDGTDSNHGSVFGQPGFFVRLDIVFDEEWHCGTGTIGDFVFLDENANGIQDENEQGIAGVKLELYNNDEELLSTVYSNADGKYEFSNIGAGKYFIRVEVPYGYSLSPRYSGENKELDSDVDRATGQSNLELGWAQQLLSFDVGLIKK